MLVEPLVVETASRQHTHTQAALRCHLLQLPCLNLTVCLLNDCVCFVWVLFCLHALASPLSTCCLRVSPSTLPGRAKRREECDDEGEEETTHTGETREGVEWWRRGGGGEADMPSCCETVPSQFQLGIQTHEPKVILSSVLYTHDNVWQAFNASMDSSCLSFTPETCRQTRPCVDMSPPSPPQQILRLTLQQFVWKSALAGCQAVRLSGAGFTASLLRIGQQWITMRPAADHCRFSVTQD